jgi:hypothetical protein
MGGREPDAHFRRRQVTQKLLRNGSEMDEKAVEKGPPSRRQRDKGKRV